MGRWVQIDKTRAKYHPLYGAGFWLWGLCFILFYRFSDALHDFGQPHYEKGLSVDIYQLADADLLYLQIAAFLRFFLFIFFLVMLVVKPRWFRLTAIFVLLLIELSATGLAFYADALVGLTKVASIIITVIFCVYIGISKRVRLTFEHLVSEQAMSESKQHDVATDAEPNARLMFESKRDQVCDETTVDLMAVSEEPLASVSKDDLLTEKRAPREKDSDPIMVLGVISVLLAGALIAAYQLGFIAL